MSGLRVRAGRCASHVTMAQPVDGALRTELERALAPPIEPTTRRVRERDGRWTVQGDPTEGALLVAARKAGLKAEALDARFQRVGEVPFSSERKLMSTVHSDTEQQHRVFAVHQRRAGRPPDALQHQESGAMTSSA